MNVIVFTKRRGRVACVNLARRGSLLFVLTAAVTVAGLLLYMGYRYGLASADRVPPALLASWDVELTQQRDGLEEAIRSTQEEMNALARQLGTLQAHVLRLDALGERLIKMASLDEGEFDFQNPPARGGPENLADSQSMTVPDFVAVLDDLAKQLEDRSRQLDVLESMLMKRNLESEAFPTGRPVLSGWLSSKFGKRTDPFTGKREYHKGIDFAGKAGSEVIAVAAGIVTWAGDRSGYGKLVEVSHGNGYVTRYGHNQDVLVEVGDRVEKGQRLGRMGSTGRSTGPHVHFEVIRNGKVVNPSKYIEASR